ncbi:MAG: hypothetical protein U1F67_06415 [Rubrivivax sp.]
MPMTAAFVPGTWPLPQVRQPRAGDVQQAADGSGAAQALISTLAVGAALLPLSCAVRAWLNALAATPPISSCAPTGAPMRRPGRAACCAWRSAPIMFPSVVEIDSEPVAPRPAAPPGPTREEN